MITQINGRVALVTGASQNIGEAVARALHAEGTKVASLARDTGPLGRIVVAAGNGALAVNIDSTNADRLTDAVRIAEAALCPIDIASNNAGSIDPSTGGLFRPFVIMPDTDWQAT